MRLVIIGPPGSGKGTQAAVLAQSLDIPHISTGEMFRNAIKADTELGRLAASYINQGNLVPDDITEGIVRQRLSRSDCRGGFLLDGFPRTLDQGLALDQVLTEDGRGLDRVIHLDVPTGSIVARLTARRVCGQCEDVYHLQANPPKEQGICDRCQGPLIQRADDTKETVLKRLEVYKEATQPLVAYYQDKGLLCSITGDLSIDETSQQIRTICL